MVVAIQVDACGTLAWGELGRPFGAERRGHNRPNVVRSARRVIRVLSSIFGFAERLRNAGGRFNQLLPLDSQL